MAWTDEIGGEVSNSYGWGNAFGDALGAWVTIESSKNKAQASAAAQEAVRSATQQATGTPVDYPMGQPYRAGMPSLSSGQMLVAGGVLLAVVLLVK